MRLAISYLKIRKLLGKVELKKYESDAHNDKYEQQYMKSLNGFLMVIDKDGDIVYISDNVVKYLGIPQVDIIGQSIYEFSHPCDHEEIREILLEKPNHLKNTNDERRFFMRMKCTLTNKGRNVNLKSATYKVVQCRGHLLPIDSKDHPACTVLIGEPIPHPSNIEMPLGRETFVSKHNMEMKYTYCDDRISELLGYSNDELLGKSVYEYQHAADGEENEKVFKDLFSKGQAATSHYRFLAKGGGYAWMVTQATVICNPQTQKPQCVVCLNYVISGIEEKGVIMSQVQMNEEEEIVPKATITMSTNKIFTPRTKEMEKEFYKPKDVVEAKTCTSTPDLDDLTHLAPVAGDVCVPLGFPPCPDNLFNDSDDCINIDSCNEDTDCRLNPIIKTEPPFIPLELTEYNAGGGCMSPLSISSKVSVSSTSLSAPCSPVSSKEEKLLRVMDEFSPGIIIDEKPDSPDSVDWEERAPFIPMDGNEDWMFTPSTHSIFRNLPDGAKKPSKPLPIMPHDTGGGCGVKKIKLTSNDEENSEKLKLMNRCSKFLEPQTIRAGSDPSARVQKARILPLFTSNPNHPLLVKLTQDMSQRITSGGACIDTGRRNFSTKPECTSVLMNLLLKGEDRNHGYSIENPTQQEGRLSALKRKHSVESMLPQITQHDAEVNAPLVQNNLLKGQDLLTALDCSDIL
ncbi:hypoxia-inducible factor 1-alpha-like isoform X2 [Tubulanus polymorphus]